MKKFFDCRTCAVGLHRRGDDLRQRSLSAVAHDCIRHGRLRRHTACRWPCRWHKPARRGRNTGHQTFSGAHAQPTTACNCIPEDISESLLKMGQAVELLTDEINTTQADEIYWFNKWTESQAEIERLKVSISIHCGSNKMIVQFQQPSERGFTFIN